MKHHHQHIREERLLGTSKQGNSSNKQQQSRHRTVTFVRGHYANDALNKNSHIWKEPKIQIQKTEEDVSQKASAPSNSLPGHRDITDSKFAGSTADHRLQITQNEASHGLHVTSREKGPQDPAMNNANFFIGVPVVGGIHQDTNNGVFVSHQTSHLQPTIINHLQPFSQWGSHHEDKQQRSNVLQELHHQQDGRAARQFGVGSSWEGHQEIRSQAQAVPEEASSHLWPEGDLLWHTTELARNPPGRSRGSAAQRAAERDKAGHGGNDLRDWDEDRIPGLARVDYPTLTKVPRTRFSCKGRHAGLYADNEASCQVELKKKTIVKIEELIVLYCERPMSCQAKTINDIAGKTS